MFNALPPEISAAIASGVTGLIALLIRWLETRLFKAKIQQKEKTVEDLTAQIEALRKHLGRSV